MRSLARIIAVLALMATTAGCAFWYRAPVVPPAAGAFNSTSAPMNLNLHSTEPGPKQGKATAVTILGLLSFGDAGIGEAARNGNIKVVNHADTEFFNILGIYASHTTVVYGE